MWDVTSRAMHFRFDAIKKDPNGTGNPFQKSPRESILDNLGATRPDIEGFDRIYASPPIKQKKTQSQLFNTPVPGMTNKFFTTKNLEGELLDLDDINDKYTT